MEYLIAVDLEGVHGVVGEAYKTITQTPDYAISCENAVKEINVAVKALFDNGAKKVVIWDNHAGGGNLDFSLIDDRVEQVNAKEYKGRFKFAENYNFKGIIFIGYHPKEGTLGGVLAHTYSSTSYQYIKINGKQLGELDFDSYLAGHYGMSPLFCSSDDKAIAQMLECSPLTETVITKYGKSRNSADFRAPEEVLAEIYDRVSIAVKKDIPKAELTFPCELELRCTRMETAEEIIRLAAEKGFELLYGEDAHTLKMTLNKTLDLHAILG